MQRLRLRAFVVFAFAVFALAPAYATERPFEVFALTNGESLGPGEGTSFSVQVIRNLETCTVCTPESTTCCTGLIHLKFGNVPAGVTACFIRAVGQPCTPEIDSDNPVAVLQAGSSIVPGTYTLHVSASASNGPQPRSSTADVALTLQPFSIHVPSSASLLRGHSQSLTLPIERVAAGAGAIDLALVSPEAGLTGTFDPDPAAGNEAALQLNAAEALPPGNYFPSVRATLGTVVRSYVINVAVAPAFSVSLSPATLVLAPGGSADVAIAIDRDAGFTPLITFKLVAPPGITGNFSPQNRLTPPQTLRLTAAPGVAVGNYGAVVTGTGGGISRSVRLRVLIARLGVP